MFAFYDIWNLRQQGLSHRSNWLIALRAQQEWDGKLISGVIDTDTWNTFILHYAAKEDNDKRINYPEKNNIITTCKGGAWTYKQLHNWVPL